LARHRRHRATRHRRRAAAATGSDPASFSRFRSRTARRSGRGDFSAHPRPQPQRREDFSRAPAPAKRDSVAERNVLVLGDAMADWLAYGLEDAYSEQPDMGVIRKHRTVSGLIDYPPKG